MKFLLCVFSILGAASAQSPTHAIRLTPYRLAIAFHQAEQMAESDEMAMGLVAMALAGKQVQLANATVTRTTAMEKNYLLPESCTSAVTLNEFILACMRDPAAARADKLEIEQTVALVCNEVHALESYLWLGDCRIFKADFSVEVK